jgi:hypothetical protein
MLNENALRILNQACEFAYMNCDREIVPGVWDSLFAGKFFELTVQNSADFVEQDQGSGYELATRLKEYFGIK